MLPEHIQKEYKSERFNKYDFNLNLYKGEHWREFNYDEQVKKIHEWEYICYDLLFQAIEIKSNLIWQEEPEITFDSPELQEEFEELRLNTDFDYIMKQATNYSYVYGDSIIKVAIDDNNETADEQDLKLSLYLQDPKTWYPNYNEYNTSKKAKEDSLVFRKDIFDGKVKKGIAILVETHLPGEIIWSCFFKNEGEAEFKEIPVFKYFKDNLEGVVADSQVSEESLTISYKTNCQYSLLQRLKNKDSIDSYFGLSDFTNPVVSKINSLNNYANLADVVIVTNSFPKLILSESASKVLDRIIEDFNSKKTIDNNETEKYPTSQNIAQELPTTFLSRQSYATSYIYKQLVNDLKFFKDDGRGDTKYLTNDFSLQEIREQHKIFFNSLMSELGISEVFYNPEVSMSATSGVAYKRLMTTTLNAIENTKRKLEPFIKKTVYTMLQLAKHNNLISSEPENPIVVFHDGIVNDEKEDLENLVIKYQNNFLPLVKAIQKANNLSEAKAQEMLDEIKGNE